MKNSNRFFCYRKVKLDFWLNSHIPRPYHRHCRRYILAYIYIFSLQIHYNTYDLYCSMLICPPNRKCIVWVLHKLAQTPTWYNTHPTNAPYRTQNTTLRQCTRRRVNETENILVGLWGWFGLKGGRKDIAYLKINIFTSTHGTHKFSMKHFSRLVELVPRPVFLRDMAAVLSPISIIIICVFSDIRFLFCFLFVCFFFSFYLSCSSMLCYAVCPCLALSFMLYFYSSHFSGYWCLCYFGDWLDKRSTRIHAFIAVSDYLLFAQFLWVCWKHNIQDLECTQGDKK